MLYAAVAALTGLGLVMLQVLRHRFSGTTKPAIDNGVSAIGRRMLGVGEDGYALPFEVVSMLLLAAMIGCIVIAMRSKTKSS
jgi:NADH-quinone oxidoreductase subunit J